MGGEPDDRARPDCRPRGGGRDVVLADVDAVGARREREVRTVVEQEADAGVGARLAHPRGLAQDVGVRGVLHPQLDQVDAAVEERPEAPTLEGGRDEVEAGTGEHERTFSQAGPTRGVPSSDRESRRTEGL